MRENFLVLLEYGENVLSLLTFMVDPIINLMSEPHHIYIRRWSIIFRILKVPKNYSYMRQNK